MTPVRDGSLRWYLVAACLFAVPPLLALAGIRLPSGSPDPWLRGEDDAKREDSLSVAIVRGDNLLRRDVFIALHEAIDELREKLPDREISWVGDVPDRTGLLVRPRPVVPDKNASRERFAAAFEELKTHPLVTGHLLSADGSTMMIPLDVEDAEEIDAAREILKSHLDLLQLEVRMTGNAALVREHKEALEDWRVFVLLSATFVVTIGSLTMLRSFRRAAAVGAGPGAAVGLAVGWLYFLGLPDNDLAKALAPVFVLVLAYADSLHIFLAVEEEFCDCGDPQESVHRAMKRMLRPCFLTSLTTSLAFASLMISNEPIVFGFGRNAAVATVMGFFGVVTVMPLVAADCVRRLPPEPRSVTRGRDRWIRFAVLLGVRRPLLITGLAVVATFASMYYARTLRPDDRINHRLSRRAPSYEGLAFADESLGGLRQIAVGIQWPQETSDETIWNVLMSVQKQIEAGESFSAPMSILNSLQLLPGKEGPRQLRYARRLARDQSARYWNDENHEARIEFRVPDRGSRYFEADLAQVEQLLKDVERAHPGFHTQLSGKSLDDSRMVRKTIDEMAWSVLLATGLILLVIWFAYGRLTYALIAILPNAFALSVTVAFRVWIENSLDISSACAASICLGIAVDDTIHFLEALRYAPGSAGSRMRILRAGKLVGRALVVTSATLLLGFTAVNLTPLPTHQFFAIMVCTMLPAALAGDLVILPAVLTLCRRFEKPRSPDH